MLLVGAAAVFFEPALLIQHYFSPILEGISPLKLSLTPRSLRLYFVYFYYSLLWAYPSSGTICPGSNCVFLLYVVFVCFPPLVFHSLGRKLLSGMMAVDLREQFIFFRTYG